ncbi:MAG: hypothetical protein H6767_09960 [Candidatus Peribacteria bacterium]|nr:MAG: hypothetical protein H6767_09960 [Candidatus Peribacteria bacterium]
MVVTLIIVTGVTGMYRMFHESQNLTLTTKNRIEAIQIAREGMEAMKNIRDTNWLIFSSDVENCWNTLNYNPSCIGDTGVTRDIQDTAHYTITLDTNNRWILSEPSGVTNYIYSDSDYRDAFAVKKDANNLYTQSGGTDFKPIYTREIQVSYTGSSTDSNSEKMDVSVTVRWSDTSTHEISFESRLTNWKKD